MGVLSLNRNIDGVLESVRTRPRIPPEVSPEPVLPGVLGRFGVATGVGGRAFDDVSSGNGV